MIERVFLIIWAVWLLLVLVAAFRVFGYIIAKKFQDRRWGDGSKDQRRVAVVIPVKGFDCQATPLFFNTLFDQDYSDYRVIACFESWGDPVAIWLKDELELTEDYPHWTHPDPDASLKGITLVCAGISQTEGQKVHNQRAAFEYLDENDAIVAFADADISFKKDWLARLVAPINQRTHTLSTTYRWLVPKRSTLPNQVASVINGSITTQGGSDITTVLWGGSMAISKNVFDMLDVPNLLEGSLNDDLRLSKAARKAGNRIAFVRSLVLPTMIDFNWKTFLEFAKRQYTQVKFFSPILYTGTNIILGIYAVGLLSILVALVHGVYFQAWIPLAAAYVIDQFRALFRQQIYLSLFQEDGIRRKLFSAGWLEHMLTPMWMMLHWMILVSTLTQSKITWAGTQYRILSKSKTRILSRTESAERLPIGAPGLALISSLHDRRLGTGTGKRSEHAPPTTETVRITTPTQPITPVSEPEEVVEGVASIEEPEVAAAVSHPGISSTAIPLASVFQNKFRRQKPARKTTPRSKYSRKVNKPKRSSEKLRVKTPVFYEPAKIANLALSLPPSGKQEEVEQLEEKTPDIPQDEALAEPPATSEISSELIPSESAVPMVGSTAARRSISGKGKRIEKPSRRRSALASRPNQTGRSVRGSRKRRVTGDSPSARP